MSHLNFPPIFVLLKLTCLVTLFDRKLQVFKINFVHSKCKRGSHHSQCWMRLFLWFSCKKVGPNMDLWNSVIRRVVKKVLFWLQALVCTLPPNGSAFTGITAQPQRFGVLASSYTTWFAVTSPLRQTSRFARPTSPFALVSRPTAATSFRVAWKSVLRPEFPSKRSSLIRGWPQREALRSNNL